jgi:hypothetical protein
MTLPDRSTIPVHWESEITFQLSADGDVHVVKTYLQDHECISWLNVELANDYDPESGLPVAQHEFAAYEALLPLGVAPKPVELRPDSIVIEYGGLPLSAESDIADDEYRRQCEEILRGFDAIGFRHNDLLPGNVLVQHGQVGIIDFTLAEFGTIDLMSKLPNPDWARAGQDARLVEFLREAKQEPR